MPNEKTHKAVNFFGIEAKQNRSDEMFVHICEAKKKSGSTGLFTQYLFMLMRLAFPGLAMHPVPAHLW